ncbi:MAG: gamma-glutamylcyclotransferase [Magnetococcales bacterium]|nr:gamma-glutamylcyclotransferase [Magnetococcales bacterium]
MQETRITFRLFVYGTLKRGGVNHPPFCKGALTITAAVVWGRLYRLPTAIPALAVPEELIRARGTADPRADAQTANDFPAAPFPARPAGDWELIRGQILTFADPEREIPPIDRLERLHPGGGGNYERVLLPALCQNQALPVWLYRMHTIVGRRIGRTWHR